jgi:hypothetical protein
MTLAHKPDAAIVDGKLVLYVGGQYLQLPPDVSQTYVRKLQGLDAKLQRQVRRQKREAAKRG